MAEGKQTLWQKIIIEQTCEVAGMYEKSFQRKPVTFPPHPIFQVYPESQTKENDSLKSDHYTITPTGPMEALIKILTLQLTPRQNTARHGKLGIKYRRHNNRGETSSRCNK